MSLTLALPLFAAPVPVTVNQVARDAARAPIAASSCPDGATPAAAVCRALKAQGEGRAADSATAFEQAAQATPASDPAQARLWSAAGNMWMTAKQDGRAASALDRALASASLQGKQRGDTLLDRARVAQALGDLKSARARTEEAVKLIPSDPFLWYFSAALAIREADMPKAQAAIGTALKLAPNDAAILFEAGHVAHAAGRDLEAFDYWTRAAAADPKGEIGKSARAAIDMSVKPATLVPSTPPKQD